MDINKTTMTDAQLERLVNETYCSTDDGFVFTTCEETFSGSTTFFGPFSKGGPVDYEVDGKDWNTSVDWRLVIKHNNSPMFVAHEIIQDLVNLELLPEGSFTINCI